MAMDIVIAIYVKCFIVYIFKEIGRHYNHTTVVIDMYILQNINFMD